MPLPWIREKSFGTSSSPEARFANIMSLKSLTFLFLLVWNKFSSWCLYNVESNTTIFKDVQNVSFQMYTSLFPPLSRLASRFAFTRKFPEFHTKGRERQAKQNILLTISWPCGFFQTTQSQSGAVFVYLEREDLC
jgi:hypothetical protein